MPILRIRTNDSETSDITIGDLGIVIPANGNSIDLDSEEQSIRGASESEQLQSYLIDDAYGANSSTLILVDTVLASDVPQDDALAFLGTLVLPQEVSSPYTALVRDYLGNPPSDLTGITASSHRTLLQLIHFIDNGPAEGFTTGATRTTTGTVFPSQILWKRADTTNLVEKNITYTGVLPTTIEWKIYDIDGTTVLATITDTISYSDVYETSRTRTIA